MTDASLKITPPLDDTSWAPSYPLPSTSASVRHHRLPHTNEFLRAIKLLKYSMDVVGKEVVGCRYAWVWTMCMPSQLFEVWNTLQSSILSSSHQEYCEFLFFGGSRLGPAGVREGLPDFGHVGVIVRL